MLYKTAIQHKWIKFKHLPSLLKPKRKLTDYLVYILGTAILSLFGNENSRRNLKRFFKISP
jgi:hypothetical protein